MQKAVRRTFSALALALACAAAARESFAYQAVFEGWLMSDSMSDAPIRIVLDLELSPEGVSGTVKTAVPQPGAGVVSGDRRFGTCDLRSELGDLTLLRMRGRCQASVSSFAGTYSLTSGDGRRQVGVFRLTKTSAGGSAAAKDPAVVGEQPREASSLTSARCSKANSACLLACPRGEYNAELLCANRCKRKLKACKAGGDSAPDQPPAPANP